MSTQHIVDIVVDTTYSRHCNWYQLYSSSFRLVSVFVCGRLYFMQDQKNIKNTVRSLNFTFRYIYDTLLLNNTTLCDCIDRFYPIDLAIKDTTDTARSASYLELHLQVDSEGRLWAKPYDKRIEHSIHICSNTCICSVYFSVVTIFHVHTILFLIKFCCFQARYWTKDS